VDVLMNMLSQICGTSYGLDVSRLTTRNRD